MPCDTVLTVTMELQAADRGLLQEALKVMGFEFSVDSDVIYARKNYREGMTIYTNRVDVRQGNEYLVRELKMQYGREVVKSQAKRTGWTVKWAQNNIDFELRKG